MRGYETKLQVNHRSTSGVRLLDLSQARASDFFFQSLEPQEA